MHRFSRWILLAAVLLASVPARGQETSENAVRLQAHNVVAPEGTAKVQIPVTISSDYADQTISGLYTVIAVGLDSAPVPVVDLDQTMASSVFMLHPNMPILQVQPQAKNKVSILALAWLPPFGTIKTGVVATVTVDTSHLAPGEYPIMFDKSMTTGTVTKDGSLYMPLLIQEGIINGTLKIVPRRN